MQEQIFAKVFILDPSNRPWNEVESNEHDEDDYEYDTTNEGITTNVDDNDDDDDNNEDDDDERLPPTIPGYFRMLK